VLPFSCKIFNASITQGISTYTAASGANFNIVAGTGTYETAAGVNSSTTQTISGTVASGYTYTTIFYFPISLLQSIGAPGINTIGILGGAVVAGQIPVPVTITTNATTGASATTAAAAFAAAINLTPVLNQLIYASSSAGVLTYTALQAGTTMNSATYTGSSTGASSAITASGSFASGTATTGVVPGVNDQFEYTGSYNFAPAGSGALGATPIFNADMPIIPVNPGPGANPYNATNFDVIYQQGTILTLRIIGTTLTYTNLVACVGLMPFDVRPQAPTYNTFDPHLDIT